MEILERLAQMPRFLDAAIESAGADLWRRPTGDFFSVGETACHLRDLEREGYLVRVRRILAEDTPDLAGFDGAAVAAERDYPSQDARVAARDFASARAELIELVRRAGRAELSREATIFGERITLEKLVSMVEEHDRGHRAEIEAIISAVEAR
jgi:hypothetical protein